MSSMYDAKALGGIKLKNAIIRSATHEGWCDDEGYPTELMAKKYAVMAKGEVGAIITGYAGIQKDGKAPNFNMNMIDDDESVPVYKELVNVVHKYNTPMIMQLAHCGRQTRSKITGMPTVAPSAIRDKHYNEDMPVELSHNAIEKIIENFVNAVTRAKKAGFDGVQLHIAHGYLLSMFLSSYANHRQDKWGGSLENRFRIIKEIISQARALVGNYPIWAKINAFDNRPGGMRIEEAIEFCKLLEKAGCDAIEVSSGSAEDKFMTARNAVAPVDGIFKFNFKFRDLPPLAKWFMRPFAKRALKPPKQHLVYNVPAAQAIKQAVSVPVIVVGGINTVDAIQSILDKGQADAVSMSRPFIMEPNLVAKFKSGKQVSARCKYCNLCMLAIEDHPLRCYNGRI